MITQTIQWLEAHEVPEFDCEDWWVVYADPYNGRSKYLATNRRELIRDKPKGTLFARVVCPEVPKPPSLEALTDRLIKAAFDQGVRVNVDKARPDEFDALCAETQKAKAMILKHYGGES